MINLLLLLLLTVRHTNSLNNGYGKTPGMGWNSDYCTKCTNNPAANGFGGETFVRHIANYLHTSGFQTLGYTFINMDASWDLVDRNPTTGNLQPDPMLWPSGIQTTIEYLHSMHFGFGLYGDKGTLDCAKHPGQLGHEVQDANYLASLGIDWWKEDSCYSNGTDSEQIAAYAKMRDALNNTGRPIWFALCGWKEFYATDPKGGQLIGNSWRIGPDTGTGWTAVMINAKAGLDVAKSQVPGPSMNGGSWSDGSLLLNPGMGHGVDLIDNTRHRTMFNLWCTLGFNLLLTGNLSALDPFVLETWSNAEVIAINQDAAGYAPMLVVNATTDAAPFEAAQAHVEECGGEPLSQEWEVGTIKEAFWYNKATQKCLNVKDCQHELIYKECTTTGNTCAGTHNYTYEQFDSNRTDKTLRSRLAPGNKCVTVNSAGLLSLSTCGQLPTDTSQTFSYSNTTKQLISTVDGRCLTASSHPPGPSPGTSATWVIARPLQNGHVVLLFLNNGKTNKTVACDATCFQQALEKSQVPSSTVPYSVRDVWLHKEVKVLTSPLLQVDLGANGDSAVFVLSRTNRMAAAAAAAAAVAVVVAVEPPAAPEESPPAAPAESPPAEAAAAAAL